MTTTSKELSEMLDRWETQVERGWLDKDELKSLRDHIAGMTKLVARLSAAQATIAGLREVLKIVKRNEQLLREMTGDDDFDRVQAEVWDAVTGALTEAKADE